MINVMGIALFYKYELGGDDNIIDAKESNIQLMCKDSVIAERKGQAWTIFKKELLPYGLDLAPKVLASSALDNAKAILTSVLGDDVTKKAVWDLALVTHQANRMVRLVRHPRIKH
jgi:hypothetical protein